MSEYKYSLGYKLDETIREIVTIIHNGISSGYDGSNPCLKATAREELKSELADFAQQIINLARASSSTQGSGK